MGAFWWLLLLCHSRRKDLACSADWLLKQQCRPCENHQSAGKWFRPSTSEERRPSCGTGLDRTLVACKRRKLLVEWSLCTSLQELGTTWTERERQWTMRHDVYWESYRSASRNGVWLLEWPEVFRRRGVPQLEMWLCLQEIALDGKQLIPANLWCDSSMNTMRMLLTRENCFFLGRI